MLGLGCWPPRQQARLKTKAEIPLIGPLLIFDKSFVQMLNPEEVFELSIHFKFVGTPVLIREIIADLKKEPSLDRIPRDVVRALSAKMGRAHGIQPANFRKLAIANLCAHEISMIGQVPVDTDAPNVHTTQDGTGLLYDSVPEQRMWDRWASANFTTDDEEIATAWRNGLEKVDLRAVGAKWKDFAAQHFGSTRNLAELVAKVHDLLSNSNREVQRRVLTLTCAFLRAPAPVCKLTSGLLTIGEILTVEEFAPYAASLTKLYLTFVGGLARGFIGPRPSHFIDLQYLFYAPFCMVFVSSDKFHREMWGATSGVNSFVWGPDLKNELGRRIAIRNAMGEEERKANAEKYDFHPMELDHSIINDVWRKYMRPRNKTPDSTGGCNTDLIG
jgi:hypothetical protein